MEPKTGRGPRHELEPSTPTLPLNSFGDRSSMRLSFTDGLAGLESPSSLPHKRLLPKQLHADT